MNTSRSSWYWILIAICAAAVGCGESRSGDTGSRSGQGEWGESTGPNSGGGVGGGGNGGDNSSTADDDDDDDDYGMPSGGQQGDVGPVQAAREGNNHAFNQANTGLEGGDSNSGGTTSGGARSQDRSAEVWVDDCVSTHADGSCDTIVHWRSGDYWGAVLVALNHNNVNMHFLTENARNGDVAVRVPAHGYYVLVHSKTRGQRIAETRVDPTYHPDGVIDNASPDTEGRVTGWVRDRGRPSTSLVADVYVDAVKLLAVKADESRADAAYGGHDKFGFSFSIPNRYFDDRNHTLMVRVVDLDGQRNLDLRKPFKIAGEGLEGCANDAECGTGQVCQSGRCISPAPGPFDPASCPFNPGTLGVTTDANVPTIPPGVFIINNAMFYSTGQQWCYFPCWEGHDVCFKELILDVHGVDWATFQQGPHYLGTGYPSLPASMGCGGPCR